SADALVSCALCDERIIVGYAVYSGALSLSPSFEKRNAGHVAICLGRIGAWRGNTGKSDRYFAAANRSCCNHRQARLRASADRNIVTQSWSAARDLFSRVRLALRTHLAEGWHAASWQLGCDQWLYVVAGPRLSLRGRLPSFRPFVGASTLQRFRRNCRRNLLHALG